MNSWFKAPEPIYKDYKEDAPEAAPTSTRIEHNGVSLEDIMHLHDLMLKDIQKETDEIVRKLEALAEKNKIIEALHTEILEYKKQLAKKDEFIQSLLMRMVDQFHDAIEIARGTRTSAVTIPSVPIVAPVAISAVEAYKAKKAAVINLP